MIKQDLIVEQTIVLKVKFPLAFGFRMWLVTKLLSLAGIITPVPIDISVETKE